MVVGRMFYRHFPNDQIYFLKTIVPSLEEEGYSG